MFQLNTIVKMSQKAEYCKAILTAAGTRPNKKSVKTLTSKITVNGQSTTVITENTGDAWSIVAELHWK